MNRPLLALSLLLSLVAAARAADAPSAAPVDRRTPVVRAIEKAGPAVVNVFTQQVTVGVDPFFEGLPDVFRRDLPREFYERRQVSQSLGSGVIIHEQGYIVTNAHVVRQGSQIRVVLADKRQFDAELLTADLDADLAIIKVSDGKAFPTAAMGSSSDLMIGESVVAIGNPFGYSNTASTGIISALDRQLDFGNGVSYGGLIQTDTAINPGNSGGALLNINGELIGINVAIRADAEGLGFAIPVDKVRDIMSRLLNFRNLKRLWLGVDLAEDRTKAADGSWQSAIRIRAVETGSPAEAAGLKAGDVVRGVGARTVTGLIDFETVLLDGKVGDKVTLKIQRDGKPQDVIVTLAEAPKPDGAALAVKRLGLQVTAVTPELVRKLGLRVNFGVMITGTEADGPAAAVGFQAGDVLIQLNTHRLAGPDDLGLALSTLDEGAKVILRVVRGRFAVRVPLTLRGQPETKH
jgi:serine protease Do